MDMAERQQYAAWKAADIRKALREGRVPQAGPPVTEDTLDLPDVPGLIFCSFKFFGEPRISAAQGRLLANQKST